MIARALATAAALLLSAPPAAAAPAPPAATTRDGEIFYQIFLRSFHDANGDRQGDLPGLTAKLDYLKRLGITAILLTPIQPSPFYHNYFATDFAGVDPDYGTRADYLAFVRAAHDRGLKVYLDQEIQYVAEGHPWLTAARGNPRSRWRGYVLWNRPGNQEPEPFLKLAAWPVWNGGAIGIAMVDLKRPAVRRYFTDLLIGFVDPHGDGSGRDGVDGLRIDHMMDDLDNKGRLTNLFADFWAPVFAAVRARRPGVRIIAEQSDWGYGGDWLRRGGVDLAFAFPLRGALVALDKAKVEQAIRETAAQTPAGKGQIVFLENHDTDRYMSAVGDDAAKARAGAALSILLRGEPLLYYGQEIGMRGKVAQAGLSDAAHIPLREAFRWRRALDAPGSAIWYARDGAPWWTGRYNRSGDGVSVEEQDRDPASLLSWYRDLLALRAARPDLRGGDQALACADDRHVLCVWRTSGAARTLVVANLSPTRAELPQRIAKGLDPLLGAGEGLAPWQVRVFGTR